MKVDTTIKSSSREGKGAVQLGPVLRSGGPPKRGGTLRKIRYSARLISTCAYQQIKRTAPRGFTHLIFALADHFEPAIVPGDGAARAPYDLQEQRLECWAREYPRALGEWRDHDGRPWLHTYFYPAEQYDRPLISRLAEFCHAGWGEIEVHLHHGLKTSDTPENTRRLLLHYRDALALEHGCLSLIDETDVPRYAFVHGNFALANSAGGRACGVDSEMQILAETGCYADMTLPTGPFHEAQTSKINSLYECALPLRQQAPHRKGHDLARGKDPKLYPLIVQGPLLPDFSLAAGLRFFGIENGALTAKNPPTLRRLRLWKKAGISVHGRPDWLFIKLHCHGMDPTHKNALLGDPMSLFLKQLVGGAQERRQFVHFVSAREMVNIILAACDGREGNPGDYRDYRLKKIRSISDWKPKAAPEAGVAT